MHRPYIMTDSKPHLSYVPPTYMGNLREFNGQKPAHMGGAYPYQKYVMYPPSRGSYGTGSPYYILSISQSLMPNRPFSYSTIGPGLGDIL